MQSAANRKRTQGGIEMTNEYDRLIGLIYEGIMDDSHWAHALAQVLDLVGAVGGGLGMQDMKTHQFRGLADLRINPDLMPTYHRLAPTNKIWQEIGQRRLALTDRMVMPKDAFVRTELYADWFVPQGFHGVMACPILFKENASAVVVAFREKRRGDFESADLAQIGRFAGHFGRALGIRLDRERTAEEFTAARLMLDEIADAILVVGFDVRLRHANKAGQTLLERRTVIRRLLNGRLEVRDAKADSTFARMVSGARGGELRLSGPGLGGFVIQVHPCVNQVHPCVNSVGDAGAGIMIVRIIDVNREGEPPTPARLRERLGLSPRQSEVISELARGGTEAKAAQRLGIGEPTVHEHIRRAYDKLELRSRAELLALLARHGFDTTNRPEKF
jgi:DNA-binding CsgD family transcriptional regulator